MSSFIIKIIAIISMLCDHASDALIGHLTFLNIIGRIAFPLFCFQLVIGYRHTKNIKKYLFRLLLFGIISQVPFSLFTYSFAGIFTNLNVFFTLALGLLGIYALDKIPNKWISIVINILIILLAELIKVDYGAIGICIILCIFVFYKDKSQKENKKDFLSVFKNNALFTLMFFILCVTRYIGSFSTTDLFIVISQLLGTFFPIIFMLLYNGKKGPSIKYFFYAFYPVHLIILVILHYIII